MVNPLSNYQVQKENFEKLLRSYDLKFFSDFSSNPKIEDVKKGVKLFNKFNPDIIISGSVEAQ